MFRSGQRRLWGVWLLGVALVGGCLQEAPTFADRDQIAPFVFAGLVEPPMAAVYRGPIPFSLNVPFRSEDVNVKLDARLFLDLAPGAPRGTPSLFDQIDASSYDDTSRSVSMDWIAALSDGCHSLTLILTHVGNFDVTTGLPIDDSRAARVVWWLAVGEADVSVSSCPGPS